MLALGIVAGPGLAAGAMHAGPEGCAMGMAAAAGRHAGATGQHAAHHGHGVTGDERPSPKAPVAAVPCCMAGCLAAVVVDTPRTTAARRPAIAVAAAPSLAGRDWEPAEPPPRSIRLLSA